MEFLSYLNFARESYMSEYNAKLEMIMLTYGNEEDPTKRNEELAKLKFPTWKKIVERAQEIAELGK